MHKHKPIIQINRSAENKCTNNDDGVAVVVDSKSVEQFSLMLYLLRLSIIEIYQFSHQLEMNHM